MRTILNEQAKQFFNVMLNLFEVPIFVQNC